MTKSLIQVITALASLGFIGCASQGQPASAQARSIENRGQADCSDYRLFIQKTETAVLSKLGSPDYADKPKDQHGPVVHWYFPSRQAIGLSTSDGRSTYFISPDTQLKITYDSTGLVTGVECIPASAPNISFKPKPLRGSA